jgi:hypothetical protein
VVIGQRQQHIYPKALASVLILVRVYLKFFYLNMANRVPLVGAVPNPINLARYANEAGAQDVGLMRRFRDQQ